MAPGRDTIFRLLPFFTVPFSQYFSVFMWLCWHLSVIDVCIIASGTFARRMLSPLARDELCASPTFSLHYCPETHSILTRVDGKAHSNSTLARYRCGHPSGTGVVGKASRDGGILKKNPRDASNVVLTAWRLVVSATAKPHINRVDTRHIIYLKIKDI